MGKRHWKDVQFERYADDIVCHCKTEQEAIKLKSVLTDRFNACGLTLHPEKTKIVYCKSWLNQATYERISFDFLGVTFQPRLVKTRKGPYRVCFLPAISQKAAKRIRSTINDWPWQKWQQCNIAVILRYSRNKLSGWMNYYGVQGKMAIANLLFHFDKKLSRWALHKYKKVKTLIQAARRVNAFRRRNRQLLAHWNRACLQG